MSSQSRLRPLGRAGVARQRTAKKDLRGTGQAGSRGGELFEVLEERRLMSVVALSGASTVNEGSPYSLGLSASGPGSTAGVADWTITWDSGAPVVLPGSATTAGHTYDDGPSSQTEVAYRTNTVTSGLASGDGFISINNVAVDSSGRIVTVGSAGDLLEVRRFNPDGTPDTTFSGDGVYNVQLSGTTDARLLDVAIDPSNRIVVAGDVSTVPSDHREGLVARFNDSGLDTSFNPSGVSGGQPGTARANFGKTGSEDAQARALVLQPDGKILVGGTITDLSGTAIDFGLARFDSSGALDTSFTDSVSPSGNVRTNFGDSEHLSDVTVATSAGVVTGIYAVGDQNNGKFAVAAYGPDGALNSTFGGGKVLTDVTPFTLTSSGTDVASNVAVDGSGRVVVSGYAGTAIGIVRYNSDGSLDTSLDGDGIAKTTPADTGGRTPDQALGNLVIDAVGSILVGARLNGGFGVVRFTPGGAVDGTFGSHGLIFRAAPDLFGAAIALQSDGGIVQAGTVPDSTDFNERNAVVLFYANAAKGIAVQNVAPTVSLTSDATGLPHQFQPFQVHLADASAADTAAGVDFSLNLGDGSSPLIASGFPVTDFPYGWIYNEAGTYTVTLTVTDKDGGTSVASTTFTIASTAVVTDDVNGGQMLVVAGLYTSPSSNKIQIKSATGGIQAVVDGVTSPVFANVGRVLIYGNEGDDDIQVLTSVKSEIYGGSGDDKIKGGGLDDVLIGEAGDDMVVGGSGRDFIVGGEGADKLIGDSDDDILIGGIYNDISTDFVDDQTRRVVVSAVMAEWSSTNTYAVRVDHLRHGNGANSGVTLVGYETALEMSLSQTVFDDDAVDKLTGNAGFDWFFANVDGLVKDKITDLTSSEFTDSDRAFVAGP